MKLKKLIKDLPIEVAIGSKEVEITGLSINSKFVCPGNLFLAKVGEGSDGSEYIHEAAHTGATAILSSHIDPFLKNVTQLVTPDVNALEGELAARFYEFPAQDLFKVGVTGTNGKTTVSYLVKYLLEKLGMKTGLIGTVEYIIGDRHYPSDKTTPEGVYLHKMFADMRKKQCLALSMEVSSHGIAQGRIDKVNFEVAVFTNLSRDHLDYHKTMETYGAEKAKLFTSLGRSQVAVINKSCPFGSSLLEKITAPTLTYGFDKGADLYADEIHLTPKNSAFRVHYRGKKVPIVIPLIGHFNVLNALAALGVLLTKDFDLEELAHIIHNFPGVPGRLELIPNKLGLSVFVDYAHTPDALEQVCRSLKKFIPKRLILVFGCGGDRDPGRRINMGAVSQKYADFTIVTNDNPRSEDPLKISQEITAGMSQKNYLVILDRKEAIKKAIEIAEQEDLILIAGKGHETYQIFSHQTIAFDDRQVAYNLLEEHSKCQL